MHPQLLQLVQLKQETLILIVHIERFRSSPSFQTILLQPPHTMGAVHQIFLFRFVSLAISLVALPMTSQIGLQMVAKMKLSQQSAMSQDPLGAYLLNQT